MQKRILIIRFGSLGDVILTSATVLNFRLNHPDSHITFLTKKRFTGVVACFDSVDEIVTLPDNSTPADYLRLLYDLDRHNYDLVVDLHGNIRSWLARKIVASGTPLVYPKRRLERQALIRRKNKVIPGRFRHTIDLYNKCVTDAGGTAYCRRPLLYASDREDLPPVFNDSSTTRVVIAPGAAHPNKQWGMKRFAEVARDLHDKRGCTILWAVTTDDRPTGEVGQILDAAGATELVDWPIDKLADAISGADLTIANDSGLMHLSSAVGTPVISVFGATHPALGFAPRGLWDRVLEIDEPCRPCSLHGKTPCFRDQRYCFTKIEVDQVVAASSELLSEPEKASPALFVDRDGTLIVEKHYLSDPDQVELIQGTVEALKLAMHKGYRIVVLSNQSGIARGYFTVEQAEKVNHRLLELLGAEGVDIDGVYYCPYYKGGTVREYSKDSNLRKPGAGMAEQAARELGLNLRRSIVIGDKIADVNLGRVIGAKSCLVRTGHGLKEEARLRGASTFDGIEVYDDLLAATNSLMG